MFKLPFNIHDYVLTEYISQGSFGCVYKARSLKYNMDFAVKAIHVEKESNMGSCLAEIEALKLLDHPNVIRIYDSFIEGNNFFMVIELCEKTLLNLIMEKEKFSESEFIQYGKEILSAIQACHKASIAHRDIKPSNFLIDFHGRIKVADFGISSLIKSGQMLTIYNGTKPYLAPEIISHQVFDPFIADIWALGVMFFQMVTGSIPWNIESKQKLEDSILIGYVPTYPDVSPLAMKLIRKMLILDPRERITLSNIVNDRVFQEQVPSLSAIPPLYNNFSKPNVRTKVINPAGRIRTKSSVGALPNISSFHPLNLNSSLCNSYYRLKLPSLPTNINQSSTRLITLGNFC